METISARASRAVISTLRASVGASGLKMTPAVAKVAREMIVSKNLMFVKMVEKLGSFGCGGEVFHHRANNTL